MGMAVMDPRYAPFYEMLMRQRQMRMDRLDAAEERKLQRERFEEESNLARMTHELAREQFEFSKTPEQIRVYDEMLARAQSPLEAGVLRSKTYGTGDLLMDLINDSTVPMESLGPLIESQGSSQTTINADGSEIITPDRRNQLYEMAQAQRQGMPSTAMVPAPAGGMPAGGGGGGAPPTAGTGQNLSTNFAPGVNPNHTSITVIDASTGRVIRKEGDNERMVTLRNGMQAPIDISAVPQSQVGPGESNLFFGRSQIPGYKPPNGFSKENPVEDWYNYSVTLEDGSVLQYKDLFELNNDSMFEARAIRRQGTLTVRTLADGKIHKSPIQYETSPENFAKYQEIQPIRTRFRKNMARIYSLVSEHGNHAFIAGPVKGELAGLVGSTLSDWRRLDGTGALDKGSIDAFTDMFGVKTVEDIGDSVDAAMSGLGKLFMGGNPKDKALAQIAQFAFQTEVDSRNNGYTWLTGDADLGQAQAYEILTPFGNVENFDDMQKVLTYFTPAMRRTRDKPSNSTGAPIGSQVEEDALEMDLQNVSPVGQGGAGDAGGWNITSAGQRALAAENNRLGLNLPTDDQRGAALAAETAQADAAAAQQAAMQSALTDVEALEGQGGPEAAQRAEAARVIDVSHNVPELQAGPGTVPLAAMAAPGGAIAAERGRQAGLESPQGIMAADDSLAAYHAAMKPRVEQGQAKVAEFMEAAGETIDERIIQPVVEKLTEIATDPKNRERFERLEAKVAEAGERGREIFMEFMEDLGDLDLDVARDTLEKRVLQELEKVEKQVDKVNSRASRKRERRKTPSKSAQDKRR